jgi:dihydroorotase-like cyclic amidohydrolase
VYVVHTSAWQSVELIRDLKDKGWPVFGETLAAFLYWTAPEADARDKGAVGKIQPPIRLDRDRDALWTGVLDGTLTSVGTDCQMYPHSSRTDVDFWDAQVGLGPGMGTALSAVHTSGVLTGRATLEDLARVLSENTARRFDLYPQKGQLAVGSDADVVVFDPTETRTVDAGSLHSARATRSTRASRSPAGRCRPTCGATWSSTAARSWRTGARPPRAVGLRGADGTRR